METLMRAQGIPLFTLESKTPLHRFDIVGFSLQYELSYTNVLAMLNLGEIPLRQKDRRDGDPIVIAGGPCVFNPEPMALFFRCLRNRRRRRTDNRNCRGRRGGEGKKAFAKSDT